MNPQDRFQITHSENGLIRTFARKQDAFEFARQYAKANDGTTYVFDCWAHRGKPDTWCYSPHTIVVVNIRKE